MKSDELACGTIRMSRKMHAVANEVHVLLFGSVKKINERKDLVKGRQIRTRFLQMKQKTMMHPRMKLLVSRLVRLVSAGVVPRMAHEQIGGTTSLRVFVTR